MGSVPGLFLDQLADPGARFQRVDVGVSAAGDLETWTLLPVVPVVCMILTTVRAFRPLRLKVA